MTVGPTDVGGRPFFVEGHSCIKNRGVHEDRKHDEDCEGGEKWDLPVVKSYRVPSE